MDFVDLILVSQVDRVIMHACPYKQPVDGTLCITGHYLILSSRKKGIDELLVITESQCNDLISTNFSLYSINFS